jgi:glycosyltransferase involved in cell wall biosynthesis
MKTKNKKLPLVSLIVTTMNNERTLDALLKTMREQTYKNTEVVVVDEYSTDATVEIAKKYKAKIYQGGPERSIKRNIGIKKAKGKYVFIFDSDQEMDDDLVEDCVQKIKNYDFLAILELPYGPDFWARCHKYEKKAYLGGFSPIEAARFFPKDLVLSIGGYDPEMVGSEDWDLTQRLLKKGYKMGYSKAMLHHNDGKYNLKKALKRKFYYGQVFRKYAQRHPKAFTMAVARPVFWTNYRLFLKNPILFAGAISIRIVEGSAVLAGMIFNKEK